MGMVLLPLWIMNCYKKATYEDYHIVCIPEITQCDIKDSYIVTNVVLTYCIACQISTGNLDNSCLYGNLLGVL